MESRKNSACALDGRGEAAKREDGAEFAAQFMTAFDQDPVGVNAPVRYGRRDPDEYLCAWWRQADRIRLGRYAGGVR